MEDGLKDTILIVSLLTADTLLCQWQPHLPPVNVVLGGSYPCNTGSRSSTYILKTYCMKMEGIWACT